MLPKGSEKSIIEYMRPIVEKCDCNCEGCLLRDQGDLCLFELFEIRQDEMRDEMSGKKMHEKEHKMRVETIELLRKARARIKQFCMTESSIAEACPEVSSGNTCELCKVYDIALAIDNIIKLTLPPDMELDYESENILNEFHVDEEGRNELVRSMAREISRLRKEGKKHD